METAQGYPKHRARAYETIYILRPNAGEEAAEKVAGRVVETIDRLEGKLVEVDVWGRRRLAYKIKGNAKGVFIYLRYLGYPGLVQEIERNMRMLDSVLKYQTVKLEDELDPATVEVDPEAIKFQGMDFSEEPEEETPPDADEDKRQADSSYLEYEPEPIPEPPKDSKKASEAKAEEPKAEEAKAEEAKAEEPKAEEAKAEEPKAEEAKAEEPKAEEAKADEAKADEAKADEPKADEAKADEPKADEPKADEAKAEEPKADEAEAEETASDGEEK